MGRAPCCEKVGLKKGRWTAEEDEILAKYIEANGEGSWRSLPKNAGLLRCGKSCRLRWINYLRADLKRGNFSEEEEQLIIKLHASLGNRWSLIAAHLPGRTDNEIKNYWNSHLSRRIHSFRRLGGDGEIVIMDIGRIPGKGKRRGGRTSRRAMKKNNINNGISIRRENKDKSGDISTSLPQSEGESNMALDDYLDPHQPINATLEDLDECLLQGEVLCPTNQDMEVGLLIPSEVVGSGPWAASDEREGGFLGAPSEDSVGWGSYEERESGVMSSSEEREGGAGLLFNEGESMGVVVALGEEEVGSSAQEEKQLDWDLVGMEAKLWDRDTEAGEMWPWLWQSDDNRQVEGYGPQMESLASWLLS